MLNFIQIAECVHSIEKGKKNNSFLFAKGKHQHEKNLKV